MTLREFLEIKDLDLDYTVYSYNSPILDFFENDPRYNCTVLRFGILSETEIYIDIDIKQIIFTEQYSISVENYRDKIAAANAKRDWETYKRLKVELYEYKENKMMEFYNSIYADTREKEVAKKIIYNAIHESETGQVTEYIPKDLDEDEVDEVVWNIIGDLVLDYYIARDEHGLYIDTIFGGNYIPGWDGDEEDC